MVEQVVVTVGSFLLTMVKDSSASIHPFGVEVGDTVGLAVGEAVGLAVGEAVEVAVGESVGALGTGMEGGAVAGG